MNIRKGLFNTTSNSNLFHISPDNCIAPLPLYEGKIFHQYDHRHTSFVGSGETRKNKKVETKEKELPEYEFNPRFWVETIEIAKKLKNTKVSFIIGYRDICRSTDERILILSALPFSGISDTINICFLGNSDLQACFMANANTMVIDYVVRQKCGGTHMSSFYLEQLPFLPPSAYTEADLAYISTRVLELSYTSYSMRPLAEALGYTGEPFPWDEDRRAQLKAELDAYYAKLYGLTREELAYILDPTTKYPTDCPTVTFPTLQNNEMKKYGEYRTQRLVLAAFDELTRQGK